MEVLTRDTVGETQSNICEFVMVEPSEEKAAWTQHKEMYFTGFTYSNWRVARVGQAAFMWIFTNYMQ